MTQANNNNEMKKLSSTGSNYFVEKITKRKKVRNIMAENLGKERSVASSGDPMRAPMIFSHGVSTNHEDEDITDMPSNDQQDYESRLSQYKEKYG
jgi:hypothetical protein